MSIYRLNEVSRIPLPGDNVAIAIRKLAEGSEIRTDDQTFTLDYTVLEGHRFAIQPIAVGEELLSWNLPFGRATVDIASGSYVCNSSTLSALMGRSINFVLPTAPNFEDSIEPYQPDEKNINLTEQVMRYTEDLAFMGYRRSKRRGVGTRNMIVLLGTSSRTGSFVKQLETRVAGVADSYENIDAIVAVAHTEGGADSTPNNLDLLLRTVAGFMVHPNVGAVLAVDYGIEPLTNAMVQQYMVDNNYALDEVPHKFLSLSGNFEQNLANGESIIRSWLDDVNATPRTEESAEHIKIALQCGGSDAFSGISGNPLASWVAREVIRYGGAANIAETDELIGAEPYILQQVRDVETARKFLTMIERFKERVSWHGHTAEGNPSGGNKFRGLYNIVLKSIGAAMKKHPDLRLDYAIEYGEPMVEGGYYFMDSPGNDLESIAGQVASGCNMIFFVTGNGSVTNFPFVPTIKFVTTSRRYRLLSKDMDVNSGAYLDGTPMDELGQQTLDLTMAVAAGQQSVGEAAGHAQTQIWRDWAQSDSTNLTALLAASPPSGVPIQIRIDDAKSFDIAFEMYKGTNALVSDQVGLILPTSLCSGQISAMTARYLNERGVAQKLGLSRFVALVHTEGCGSSSGSSEALHTRTMLGYAAHPLVRRCMMLEHGCEKTHNDHMRNGLAEVGLAEDALGWASVQLDGGIEKVMAKIEAWFLEVKAKAEAKERIRGNLGNLRVGLASVGPISDSAAVAMAVLTKAIVAAGGLIVVPENTTFLSASAYRAALFESDMVMPSLAYGERASTVSSTGGFHVMGTPTQHWVETLSGLGGTGVEVIIAYVGDHPVQTHPLVPVLQVTAEEQVEVHFGGDLDLVLGADADMWAEQILALVADLFAERVSPRLYEQGNVDFQITRGLLGVSM